MKNRIKEVRLESGLSQADFARKQNLSRNYLWMIEAGERVPGDRTISDICQKFGVNEVWLRSGEGERDKKISRKEEIGLYVRKLLKGECSELEETLISFMANTSVDEWKMLTEMLKRLNEQYREKEKTEAD